MDAEPVPKRHPLRLAGLVAAGAILVLALAAAILFLWLRTYAPLSAVDSGGFAPGPGLGADIEPVTGSGGRPVFIPAYRAGRPFDTAFTLHNTGRFAVEVTGLGRDTGVRSSQAATLFATDSSTANADPGTCIRSGACASTAATRRSSSCAGGSTARRARRSSSRPRVPLRYTYLTMFTRTERIALPFAVTLRCSE